MTNQTNALTRIQALTEELASFNPGELTREQGREFQAALELLESKCRWLRYEIPHTIPLDEK